MPNVYVLGSSTYETILIFRQIQPRILPRPDLARLGINYRRIPLLAIGCDVYLDSRLIIYALE
jgi:hypothetical protein